MDMTMKEEEDMEAEVPVVDGLQKKKNQIKKLISTI